jgi:hypothetical protein
MRNKQEFVYQVVEVPQKVVWQSWSHTLQFRCIPLIVQTVLDFLDHFLLFLLIL